jgi:CheY-like chemotaxis protein
VALLYQDAVKGSIATLAFMALSRIAKRLERRLRNIQQRSAFRYRCRVRHSFNSSRRNHKTIVKRYRRIRFHGLSFWQGDRSKYNQAGKRRTQMQDLGICGATQTTSLGNLPRLLVIDDELVQRTIISKIGQQVGYEVLAVASFEEAARMLQDNAYDCITLDLSLGEHSGTQLLRSIAEAGKTSVIVISGCEERVLNSAVRLANMLGIACIQIPKPLDLTELRRSLSAKLPNEPRAPRGDIDSASHRGFRTFSRTQP